MQQVVLARWQLFLGIVCQKGVVDKLSPSKLSAGVNTDSCAGAVTVYAKGDIDLSTLSSLLVDLRKKTRGQGLENLLYRENEF